MGSYISTHLPAENNNIAWGFGTFSNFLLEYVLQQKNIFTSGFQVYLNVLLAIS